MRRSLVGKRVIITGASSGIGRELAVELTREGANLLVVSRSNGPLEELAKNLSTPHNKVNALAADITLPEDRQKIIENCKMLFGGIDILINNAGIASWGHFANADETILRQIMEVNFFAPVELIRAAIPALTLGNQSLIVNVSSMCGRKGMPAWPEYSASKFALCGITEALRGEFARFDIDTLVVVPGLTRTNLRENMPRNEGKAKIDFNQGMSAEAVACKILAAIRSNKRECVIGSDARWMLRMHRWLPKLLDRLLARKVQKLYQNDRPEKVK